MTTRQDKWAELARGENKGTYFGMAVSDEDLAEKLNTFLSEYEGVISAEDVRRNRQRYYLRPTRGAEIGEQEASPTKNVIRNKATQLSVQEALAEILDNIFDNFERNRPDALAVELTVYPETSASPAELFIKEDSGGIEKRRVIPLIQLGLSEGTTRGIGAWGEGFKMAVFALGAEVEVFSTYPGEEPIAIHFPHGWLDPSNTYLWARWKVNTYQVRSNPPPSGTTFIRINHLHDAVCTSLGFGRSGEEVRTKEVVRDLADYFGEVYSQKYHQLASEGHPNLSITLTVGSSTQRVSFKDKVKDRLERNLAFIPWLRPIHWTAQWETEVEDPTQTSRFRLARLNVEVYAGLAATFNYTKRFPIQPPGVEMWGNGRLFSLDGRITDSSVGWEYKFGGSGGSNPASTATARRLLIVALFTAEDSRDIPWAAPVKNGYNRRSEFYAEIQHLLAKVIRLYKNGIRMIEASLLPFSAEWLDMSDEAKLNRLFGDSDATPQFLQEFAASRLGRKVLSYEPQFTFIELQGADAESTALRVHGVPGRLITDASEAAQNSKSTAQGVVEYLKAIFPHLHQQAELENLMQLAPDEELGI